jgi:CheY-like chemotaxis protein
MSKETNGRYALLVEDNDDDVLLTKLAFQNNRITNKLVVIRDGEEAIDFFLRRGQYADHGIQENPAVILLDLKLPKVDGIEILKKIRTEKSTHDTPVVILTSSMEPHDQRACYRLGISDYIQKPTGLSGLINLIQRIKNEFLD